MKNKCVIGTWGWGNGFNGSGMIFGSTPKETELAMGAEATALESMVTAANIVSLLAKVALSNE